MGKRSPESEPLADLWLLQEREVESVLSGWEAERQEFRPDFVEPSLSGEMTDPFAGEEERSNELSEWDFDLQ